MQGEMVVAVAVASPSSAAAPSSAGRLHPTYKEMILQALTELQDPSGSSRSAIAGYIADHFSGLHSRHDALLSVHLRRLRSHGQLRQVKGNYFVSGQGQGSSSPPKHKPAAPGQKRGRGRPRKNPDSSIPAFQGPKRGRGRPRKNSLYPVASPPSPLHGASAPPPPSGVKRGCGRPRKNALFPPLPSSPPPLGAIDPPPPSSSPPLGASDPPPPSGVKRGRGRPRKGVPVRSSFSQLLEAIAPPPPSGVKRGRGRPRKNAYPAVAPLVGVEEGPAGGQPQRNTTPLSPPLASTPHSGKPVRPLRVAVDVSALRGSSLNISACSNSVVGAKSVDAGKEEIQPESVQSADASLTKRGRGRPRKDKALESGHLKAAQMTEGQHEHEALTAQAADQAGAVQNEVEARDLQSLGTSLTEKRGRGRPRKRPLETKTAEAGVTASAVKRGRGRPRKEKTLETVEMTEGQHEALPAQTVDQDEPMQNEAEARILQSFGTPLIEKRGRGRPRKRPLETETAETQVNALVKKRGRGRPRKENPSAERSAGTRDAASMAIKRGRGRPRKVRPLETGSVETAVDVSRDLTEDGPEKDGDLVPGKKAEIQGVLLVEGIDNGPTDAGCLVVSREEVAIAPVDAGGVLLPGEKAAIAPMDAGRATPRVDPMDVSAKSH